MDFLALAKKRYSVRQYEAKPVEQEKIERILEAGRVAPTGVNYQPQRILVVNSSDGLQKIQQAANIYKAPLALVVCTQKGEAWVNPYDGKSLQDIDVTIITDHMMLQAEELGLGTCWICHFDPKVLKEQLEIPSQYEPVHILIAGYARGAVKPADRHNTARKPLAETVFYESWNTPFVVEKS